MAAGNKGSPLCWSHAWAFSSFQHTMSLALMMRDDLGITVALRMPCKPCNVYVNRHNCVHVSVAGPLFSTSQAGSADEYGVLSAPTSQCTAQNQAPSIAF